MSILILTTLPILSRGDNTKNTEPLQEVEIQNAIIAVSGADLEISPVKVTKTMTWTMNFLAPLSLEQRKENLIKILCKETGADKIIDPQFTFSKRILGGGKLVLTGYPAFYKNFRPLNETEIDSLVIKKRQPTNTVIFISD